MEKNQVLRTKPKLRTAVLRKQQQKNPENLIMKSQIKKSHFLCLQILKTGFKINEMTTASSKVSINATAI
jgi:hypothetical protein